MNKYDGLVIPVDQSSKTTKQTRYVKGIGSATKIDIAGKFKNKDEAKLAKVLLDRYLKDYDLETVSDSNTIQEVIYYEVLQTRLQDKINDLYANNVKAIPYDMVGVMHKNSEVIIKLKSTLGLNRANRDKLVGYDAYTHWISRFRTWLSENQASRTMKCPHCQQFIMLKMRLDYWDTQKHPFFQDNMVYNKHLMAHLGKTVYIDEQFVADVLETAKDYVIGMVRRATKPGNPVAVPTL